MNLPCSQVTIRTGSRLHCGLFSDSAPQGYRHQGMGLMIDSPGFHLTASITDSAEHYIDAEDEIYQRIQRVLIGLDRSSENQQTKHLEIRVEQTIPLHCGFGSGTQLALAVGHLWAWFNQPDLSTQQLARLLNRSRRSCIGTYGFDQGGMLIDRGIAAGESVGKCRFRTSLPESWRILLVRPLKLQGFSGESETEAFQQLPEIAASQVDRLQHLLTVMETRPDCFNKFSAALREYGMIVGESFAAVQGGCFSAKIGQQIFDLLSSHGLQGIAQSSWGPTMFGLCENLSQAEELKESVHHQFPELEIQIARLKNDGTKITG